MQTAHRREKMMRRFASIAMTALGLVFATSAHAEHDGGRHSPHDSHSRDLQVAADGDPMFPPPECHAYVAYDRDMVLPGYILPTSAGPRTCIPFTSTRARKPVNDRADFYVDNFTDQKLRERWEHCERDKDCRKRVYKQVVKRHPPNKEHDLKDPRGRFLLGKIDEHGGDTDLTQVRRPSFFAREPYDEPIAKADKDTYVVEFTAPVEAYERLKMAMTGDIKLRGWYIRGQGVSDGKGERRRALIIMNGGGGDRVTAIDDPKDVAYVVDPKTGLTIPDDDWPKGGTGVQGERFWRQTWYRLHEAGFDVLAMDRRGVGISGGFSDTNTLQQGHDLLDIVAALRSGQGMRAMGPDDKLTIGADAARAVRDGASAKGLPVFFMGSSRGTMASGWAMTINFDKDCSYDLPKIKCRAPVGDRTVKGAILIADFSSGVGYLESETSPKDDGRGPGRDRGLFIGGIEEKNDIVFFPSSAILHGIGKWPSGFFARGLWCYADGLEGEIASYGRVKGLKELDVVRGPHPFETWPASEKERIRDRIIAYATAVLFDQNTIPGQRPWTNMKQLVATSSDVWEPSTKPTQVP
jgi:pimeloyl-ACP methyl ester carboxylesterase